MRWDAYGYVEFRRFVAVTLWDLDVSVQSSLCFVCLFFLSQPRITVYFCVLCCCLFLFVRPFFGSIFISSGVTLLLYYCSALKPSLLLVLLTAVVTLYYHNNIVCTFDA